MADRPSSHVDDMSDSSSEGSAVDFKQDSEGWEDLEPDVETVQVKDFFSDKTFPSATEMLEYCKKTHAFDFSKVQSDLHLDFLGSVKLVNFVRKQAQNGQTVSTSVTLADFDSDEYLQPTLEDDALLFSLDDIIEPSSSAKGQAEESTQDLQQRLQDLELHFTNYRSEVAKTLDDRWGVAADASLAEDSTDPQSSAAAKASLEKYDNGYFETYSYNDIHQVMLQDTIRTDAYRDFIYSNKHLFAGKTVLDVGCGTGILSMFCAKAGAARVISVDNSAIIEKAKTIIKANGLDGVITCVRGKIEEITLPDGIEKVDIIVSEWMGYCLLFEAMLDSVLVARDRYLKPDGLMVPSHCTLHLGALEDDDFVSENFSFWQDVYGFDMTAMTEKIYDDVLVTAPSAAAIAGRTSGRKPFQILNLHTVTKKALEFQSPFEIVLDREVDRLDGFCVWFDTIFMSSRNANLPEALIRGDGPEKNAAQSNVWFSTGPFTKHTHWQCGLCIIDRRQNKASKLENGSKVDGSIKFTKNSHETRAINIELVWGTTGTAEGGQQEWFMR